MNRKKHNRLVQEHKKAEGRAYTKVVQAQEKPWVKAYQRSIEDMSTEVTQQQLEASRLYRRFDDPQRQAIEDAALRKFMLSARKVRQMAKTQLGR